MKKVLKVLVPVVMVILILVSIGWYLFVYDREFTRDVLLSRARYHTASGNDNMASWYYNLAYDYAAQDEHIAIELANQYKADGNYTKAEFTLANAIRDGGETELYVALCRTYVEQDKLIDAVTMLDNVTNPAIKAELDAMRPEAPATDLTPGTYHEYLSVNLTSPGARIYYTADGMYPSMSRDHLTNAISLPVGETTIRAIAVDPDGLVSPLVKLEYTIGGIVEEVNFTDPAVEEALRKQIGKVTEPVIYTNDLWPVTKFTLPSAATSLADLKFLPNLEELTIQRRHLPDLNFLEDFPKLQALDLSGSRFPSNGLYVVGKLTELRRLNLTDCGLSTLAGVQTLENMTHLYLGNNTLRNLDPIARMYSLVEVDLDHNAVVDLKAFQGLVNLEKLDLAYNSVEDLQPLASCVRLTNLDLSHNAIEELSALNNLNLLTELSLETNQVKDVSILADNTALVKLNISENEIEDISMLAGLISLEEFRFAKNQVKELPQWPEGKLIYIDGTNNQIGSIDVLGKMTDLTYVYLDYNKIKNVDALGSCYRLMILNVYGNEIKNTDKLEEFSNMGILVNYNPV